MTATCRRSVVKLCEEGSGAGLRDCGCGHDAHSDVCVHTLLRCVSASEVQPSAGLSGGGGGVGGGAADHKH